MKPELRQFIRDKRAWSEPLSPEDVERDFRGWYSPKYLPHFDAPGLQQFITYRLADSMPSERRHEWEAFLQLEDNRERRRRIEAYLDRGYGRCSLRDDRVAEMVQSNLWHHDGRSYRLLAWVVMPNHVHTLIEVWQVPLGKILQSWKSYTSKRANAWLGCQGSFWEEDYFDRYIRDEKDCCRVVRYIENNPVKAGLVATPEEWPWSSARHRRQEGLPARTLTHPAAGRSPDPPT